LQTDVNVGSNSENARPKKRAGRRTANSSNKGAEKYRKRRNRFGIPITNLRKEVILPTTVCASIASGDAI